MKPGTLLIRADASISIGTGHVMRCLALAQAWQDAGGNAVFAMAQSTPAIEERLRAEAMAVEIIRSTPGSVGDVQVSVEAARRCGAQWVVVDGYHFGAEYQQVLKDAGIKVVFIDDTAESERYVADLVLNQNVYANVEVYRSQGCTAGLLLGPRYALLRREFISQAGLNRSIPEVAHRLLVTFGGSDPDNVTSTVLESLALISPSELETVVVVGGSSPHLESLRTSIARSSAPVRLLSDVRDMAEWIKWADVAVSAAGTICWEMCLLGLPAILIDIAPNQTPVAEELDRLGAALHLGNTTKAVSEKIAYSLQKLILSKERRAAMSHCAATLVDGRGAERIVAAIRCQGLRVRELVTDDCRLLWDWANDPAVRSASFSQAPIPWENHQAWFAAKIRDRKSLIFIAEDEHGCPVGQFRMDRQSDEDGEIDITVAPDVRGAGYGRRLIELGVSEVFSNTATQRLHAYIRPENQASILAFERAGFRRQDMTQVKGCTAIEYVRVRDNK